MKKAVCKLLEMNAVVLGADRQLHMTAVGQRLLELPLPPDSAMMVLVRRGFESEG